MNVRFQCTASPFTPSGSELIVATNSTSQILTVEFRFQFTDSDGKGHNYFVNPGTKYTNDYREWTFLSGQTASVRRENVEDCFKQQGVRIATLASVRIGMEVYPLNASLPTKVVIQKVG